MLLFIISINIDRPAIAQALHTKVYCDFRKAAILRCQSDPELHALLTTDPVSAGVHLVPLGVITSDKLKTYMDRFKGKFARAIGFRPTGWTYVLLIQFLLVFVYLSDFATIDSQPRRVQTNLPQLHPFFRAPLPICPSPIRLSTQHAIRRRF